MDAAVDFAPSPIECNSISLSAPIWQDVLAQAITGELFAAMNYTSLADVCDDPAEVAEALEHAHAPTPRRLPPDRRRHLPTRCSSSRQTVPR